MKNRIILLLLFYLTIVSFSANSAAPRYLYRSSRTLELTNVVLSDTATILSFTEHSPSGRALIKGNYIQSSKGGEKYLVRSTIGLPSPMGERWKVDNKKPVAFSVIFPKIDKNIESINFTEPATKESNEPWQIFGIKLKKHIWTSKLPQALAGKWLRTDGSNLLFVALYEEAALLDAQVWQYDSVNVTDKQTEIVLKISKSIAVTDNKGIYSIIEKEKQTRKLIVETDNTGILTVTEEGKPSIACSRQRTKDLQYFPSDKQPFAKDIFKSDSATYCGYIHRYTPLMPHKLRFEYDNATKGRKVVTQVSIAPNGYFETRIKLDYPIMVNAHLKGFGLEHVLLEPGKKTFQSLEFRTKKDIRNEFYGTHRCSFMGDNAELNEEIHILTGKEDNLKKLHDLIAGTDIHQFSDSVTANYQREQSHFANYKQERNLSPKAEAIINANISMKRTSLLSEFAEYKLKDIVDKNPKTYMSFLKTFKKAEIDSISALSFIESVKQPTVLLDFRFYDLLLKLPSNNYFIPIRAFVNNMLNIFFNVAKQCKELTPEEITLQNELKAIRVEDVDTAHLRKHLPEVLKFIANHQAETQEYVQEFSNSCLLKSADTYLSGTPWVIDLIKSSIIIKKLNDYNLLTDEQLKEATAQISNPFIAAKIAEVNVELRKIIAANKGKVDSRVMGTPNVEPEKLFETILQKYRGHVIYVDFWATWCGPCMRNIAAMKTLKDELKAYNVAFVYITNQTSPKALWENVIPDISGDHYRLTRQEWNVLSKKYNVTSIPHGILINQRGEIVSPKIQGLTNEDVKTMIYSTLGKELKDSNATPTQRSASR